MSSWLWSHVVCLALVKCPKLLRHRGRRVLVGLPPSSHAPRQREVGEHNSAKEGTDVASRLQPLHGVVF